MDGDFAGGIAGPQRAGQLRGIAAEPQVGVVVGGAGLASIGLVDAQGARGAGAAAAHDARENVGYGSRLARGEDLLGVVGMLVQDGAGAGVDLGDGNGLTIIAAVGKRCIG